MLEYIFNHNCSPNGCEGTTFFTESGLYLHLGLFYVQFRSQSDSMTHLHLPIAKTSERTESTLSAVSGKMFETENAALTALVLLIEQAVVALPPVSISFWHHPLDHPNTRSGVKFSALLMKILRDFIPIMLIMVGLPNPFK